MSDFFTRFSLYLKHFKVLNIKSLKNVTMQKQIDKGQLHDCEYFIHL